MWDMKSEKKFKETKIGEIPEDWRVINGTECLILDIGSRPSGGVTDKGDIPSIGGEHINITSGRIDFFRSPKYISMDYFSSLKRGRLRKDDILINKDGAYTGKLAFTWELFAEETAVNEHVFIIRNKGQFNQKFLFYYLNSKMGKHQVRQHITGSAQPGLNRQFVEMIFLPLPTIEEQRRIVNVLSSLDEQINNYLKMNKTLEAIGQAIFKHWFVDFEFPNDEGKPYKSSGGEMVDAELGDIPEGWRICKLNELVTISKESCNPSKTPEDTFIYYSISAYDNGEIPVEELGKNILSNKFIVKGNSILLCKLNPRFPRCWAIWDDFKKKSVSSTEFLVLIPKKVIYYSFIYRLLKSNYVQNSLQSHITGTSSSHQRVRPKDILELNITIPTEKILTKYHKATSKTLIKIDSNKIQNNSLSHIRDSLLPRLMSGRIRMV